MQKNMKNKLKALFLASAIGLSSCATFNPYKNNYIENLEMITQNSILIKEDIFDTTKILLKDYPCYEENFIADLFFKNNQWELCYTLSVGANIALDYISYKIDKKGILAKIINGGISLGEGLVILNNEEDLRLLGYKKQYPKIEAEIFRIDY